MAQGDNWWRKTKLFYSRSPILIYTRSAVTKGVRGFTHLFWFLLDGGFVSHTHEKNLQKWQPLHRSHSLIGMEEQSLFHYGLSATSKVKTISYKFLCLPRDTRYRVRRVALDKGTQLYMIQPLEGEVCLLTKDIATRSSCAIPHTLGS